MTNKIRIAFSGSGYKVVAFIGAMTALKEADYEIIELAGTSGGSLVAALIASGMSLVDMKSIVMTKDWSSFLEFNFGAITSGAYCEGDILENWVEVQTKNKTFKDLDIDLTIVASDLSNMKGYYFNKTNTPDIKIAHAARASASIPYVYEPIHIGDSILVDGGLVNNIAVDKLVVDSVPRLGIQLTSNDSPVIASDKIGIVDEMERILDLMLSAQENCHIDIADANMVFVETGYTSCLDTNMTPEIRKRLFDDGYNETKKVLDKMKLV